VLTHAHTHTRARTPTNTCALARPHLAGVCFVLWWLQLKLVTCFERAFSKNSNRRMTLGKSWHAQPLLVLGYIVDRPSRLH